MSPKRAVALRGRPAKVLELPKPAQSLIKHYADLHIMGTHCSTPYHINCRLFSRNRALVGKGRPEEIEAAAEHFFKRFNTVIKAGDSARLKASLRDYGIGIDCSGFAAWVVNELTRYQIGTPIWKCLRFPNARSRAVSKFRPIENISATLLTGERNAKKLENLYDIRPGDLIRALHGGHVIVVTETGVDANGHALYFKYAHSAAGNETVNGVNQGLVTLTRPEGQLADQEWTEDDTSISFALLTVQAGGDDSKAVRLRALTRT